MNLRPLLPALVLSGTSGGCAFSALGVALYGAGPHAAAAAGLFGGIGFVSGVAAFGLPLVVDRLPAQARLAAGLSAAQGPSTLQVLARATLATVQQAAREPGPRGAGAAAPAAPAAEVASALPKASATDKAPHDDRVGA